MTVNDLCRVGLISMILFKIPALRAQVTLRITKVPDSPVYVEIGKVLKLDISYEYDGTKGIRTSWKKEGSTTAFIRRNADGSIFNNADNRASMTDRTDLVLNNVKSSDNTTFEVELAANDSADEPKETIDVIVVEERPKVQIECLTKNQGATVECDCEAIKGIPKPWVTWYDKNDSAIGSATYGSNKLSINNIQPANAGSYKCEAQIAPDIVDEGSRKIGAPENVKIGDNEAYENTKFMLTCSAEGFPPASYTIYHNGTLKDSTNGAYTINKVKKSDAGNYTCVAGNKLGNIKTSIDVEVSGNPSPTSSLTNTTSKKKATCENKWYLNAICIVCGLVVGALLTYITMRWRHSRAQTQQKKRYNTVQYTVPSDHITTNPTDYQELDVNKMNQPDNYQSLKKPNEHQASGDGDYEYVVPNNYQRLSNVRDTEQKYQSLKKV